MVTFDQLTPSQRYIIAEFVYSFREDILIKSDVTALAQVLFELGLLPNFLEVSEAIDRNDYRKGIHVVGMLLTANIAEDTGQKIMDEYIDNAEKFLNG